MRFALHAGLPRALSLALRLTLAALSVAFGLVTGMGRAAALEAEVGSARAELLRGACTTEHASLPLEIELGAESESESESESEDAEEREPVEDVDTPVLPHAVAVPPASDRGSLRLAATDGERSAFESPPPEPARAA